MLGIMNIPIKMVFIIFTTHEIDMKDLVHMIASKNLLHVVRTRGVEVVCAGYTLFCPMGKN